MMSIEDQVKFNDVVPNIDYSRDFNYVLNDKASKAKLLKGAKRSSFVIEENSTSNTLIFSAGAWQRIVLPLIKYWGENSDKSCQIGDSFVKIGGIQAGRDASGTNHVDTKIVFFADREKITCHFYNTTQKILINGHGYKRLVDIFLKPLFETKISAFDHEITLMNEEICNKLGGVKMVKRSSVKYKGGNTFPCNRCDYACRSISTLKKHKESEHNKSINSSQKLVALCHSTRNNSAVINNPTDEKLMLENITLTDLTSDSVTIEDNLLKFTCLDCKFSANSKESMNSHVHQEHTLEDIEQVEFKCKHCNHAFSEAENYDIHMQSHDNEWLDVKKAENKLGLSCAKLSSAGAG